MIIVYTTTDKIRAAIGCDTQDLPDEVINNRNLDLLMLDRLDDVFPNHENASTTQEERRLALWCMYFGALTLIEDATLSLALKIQSNTDQIQRFDIDFEALKTELRNKIAVIEDKLNPDFFATAFSVMGSAKPDYDPIVGA